MPMLSNHQTKYSLKINILKIFYPTNVYKNQTELILL